MNVSIVAPFHAPRARQRGAALVELAVVLPLLIVVLVGTVDFARVFYAAIVLTDAARAGAQYASITGDGDMTQTGRTVNTALDAAVNINVSPNLVTVTASRACQCVNDAGTFSSTSPANTCTGTPCSGSNRLVVTVTVTAQKTFTTIASFPGVPSSIGLTRSATLQVPN